MNGRAVLLLVFFSAISWPSKADIVPLAEQSPEEPRSYAELTKKWGYIRGLELFTDESLIVEYGHGPAAPRMVEIHGTYRAPDPTPGFWTLMRSERDGGGKVSLSPSGEFTFEFPVENESQELELTAIGPGGLTESLTLEVRMASANDLNPETTEAPKKPTRKAKPRKPQLLSRGWSFNVGTGLAHFDYREDLDDFKISTLAQVANLGASYELVPGTLDLGGSAFVTLYTLANSSADFESARYVGLNGRLSYHFLRDFAGQDLSIGVGPYYWDMIVPDQSYGIRSLLGPQFFLATRAVHADARTMYAYIKVAPISDDFSQLKASNRELAFGAGYQLNAPAAKYPLLLTLDLSDARFFSQTAGNGMELKSCSLGVQVAF